LTDINEQIRRFKAGDAGVLNDIITENSGLVWSVVRRFMGRGTDSDDLYQLGCMGLIKAVHGFEASFGYKFSTYAVPKIAGEIRRFLRDDGMIKVSRSLKETNYKINRAREDLAVKLGREPVISEISGETGISPDEIAQAEYATGTADSLNRETNQDGQTLEDILFDTEAEERLIDYISLREAIEKLKKRDRMVIYLRYYKSLTQDKTAKVLNISQVQVSRIERRAIESLKGLVV